MHLSVAAAAQSGWLRTPGRVSLDCGSKQRARQGLGGHGGIGSGPCAMILCEPGPHARAAAPNPWPSGRQPGHVPCRCQRAPHCAHQKRSGRRTPFSVLRTPCQYGAALWGWRTKPSRQGIPQMILEQLAILHLHGPGA